jgi:hypothetical protein
MRSLRTRGIGVLLVALLALAGCGESRERALCSQYDDFRDAAAQVQELDPATATSDDVRAVADDVRSELSQLQSASDGVYDSAISNLRASLTVLSETAVDLPLDDLDLARDLIRDAWDDVLVNYAILVQRLDVACETN